MNNTHTKQPLYSVANTIIAHSAHSSCAAMRYVSYACTVVVPI